MPRQPDHPAAGNPQIFEVDLNDNSLRSRGPIDIRVLTSPEVTKVVSRSNGQEGNVPRVGPGEFAAMSRLPVIPFIASGMTIKLQFVASTPDGHSTTVAVPVKLR